MLFAILFQMHRHGPLFEQSSEVQHLLKQFLFMCHSGNIGETGSAKSNVEQQREQMFLFPIAVVDLLDTDLVPDSPDQV